jgi:hypothetical protein
VPLSDVKEVVLDDFERVRAHDDYFTAKPDVIDKLGFTPIRNVL